MNVPSVTVACVDQWRLGYGTALQTGLPGAPRSACLTIVPCDPLVAIAADDTRDAVVRRLLMSGATAPTPIAASLDPLSWGCPTSRGRHVLVLLIGDPTLDSKYEWLANAWHHKYGDDGVVLCALTSTITHGAVFGGGTHPMLAMRTAATWHDDPDRLAGIALDAALGEERPGVFVSYVRDDATAAADTLHGALTSAGFRVFVDRITGMPGRAFPLELREAMADMGLVLVLETPKLPRSKWTMREAMFAHRYRIGPVAVNFDAAPELARVRWRHWVGEAAHATLAPATIDGIVTFVRDKYLAVAAYRRAFFETLVDRAVRRKGGVMSTRDAVMIVEKPAGTVRAHALVSARPGQLRHVHPLVASATGGTVPPLLLAGEHDHLHPHDARDLRWLARQHGVTLAGSASLYRAITGLL